MSVTILDPITALIVIDLQKGLRGFPTVDPIDDVIKRAGKLASAFRDKGLPVVLVNVTGGAPGRTEAAWRGGENPPDWADLVPELGQAPGDHTVTKKTWGAFTNTDLDDYLKSKNVTHVVVVGVATSIGVESTARFAHELGYNVTIAIDAVTDLNPEAQVNSLTRIFPRLGEIGTVDEIIEILPQPTV